MYATKTTVVLLVEDDAGDQKLIRQSLANQEARHELHIVESGEEALEYLQHSKSGDEQNPWPNLILLDLNMPGMGGREFLKHIKTDDDLCGIPVIILTVSDSEIDIQESYRSNAAGYVQKTASPEEFQEVLGKLAKYWFTTSLFARS